MEGDRAAAGRYRQRAEEVRNIAEKIKDAKSRELLVGIAEDYEHMARQMDGSADIESRLKNIYGIRNSN